MDERDALGVTMEPAIPPRYVSLIGLPGSGKTTLCRSLAKALGWQAFVIGDALRARAATDPALQTMLDGGQLAPENVAIEMMMDAAKQAAGRGLIVDGFPRHRDQLNLAKELFDPWIALYLRVPRTVAESRLRNRVSCSECKWVGTLTIPEAKCPQCGNGVVCSRPEDQPPLLYKRSEEAEDRLAGLLDLLGDKHITQINASEPADHVLQAALDHLARPY
jgi:adenylate kinase family enzyme